MQIAILRHGWPSGMGGLGNEKSQNTVSQIYSKILYRIFIAKYCIFAMRHRKFIAKYCIAKFSQSAFVAKYCIANLQQNTVSHFYSKILYRKFTAKYCIAFL